MIRFVMQKIKNNFRKIFFNDVVRSIVFPVIVINILSILFLFAVSLFIDYKQIYTKTPFPEFVEFQVLTFGIIILFEIILISVISFKFFKRMSVAGGDIKEVLKKGENNRVEFKSSLRFDYVENKVNRDLEYVIAKTISAFLNSQGGVLFIGVDDGGNILGLENDYGTLKKKNFDGFLVYLTQVVNQYLGKEVHRYININMEKIEEKEICVVQILRSKKPVYLKNSNNRQEFFIRAASSVESMDVRDAHNYIINHWKDN